jgi:hypothetical protein
VPLIWLQSIKYFLLCQKKRKQELITDEEITNSCFSLVNEKKTFEVMPAKHVTDAALTYRKIGISSLIETI